MKDKSFQANCGAVFHQYSGETRFAIKKVDKREIIFHREEMTKAMV